MKIDLVVEITVDSVKSAVNAELGGADRVELCQDLALGGTTPSYGLLKGVISDCNLPIVPIVRPRSGDFLYDSYEFEAMLYDVEMMKELGIKQIITGILTKSGKLDVPKMERLISHFYEDGVCLHRAFDMCADLEKTYEVAKKMGIQRILTSGGKRNAVDGIDNLKLLNELDGPVIVAGCGINSSNVQVFRENGIRQIHTSAKTLVKSKMTYVKDDVVMGGSTKGEEYSKYIAGIDAVKEVVNMFRK